MKILKEKKFALRELLFQSKAFSRPRINVKKSLQALLITSSALLSGAALAATVLEENFDSGTGSFNDTGRVYTGSYGVRLRGGSDSNITSSDINTQSFSNLILSYNRSTSGLDSGENATMAISIAGDAFTSLEAINSSTDQRVNFSLPAAASNTTIRIRFALEANSFFDTAEVDDILLEGSSGGSTPRRAATYRRLETS